MKRAVGAIGVAGLVALGSAPAIAGGTEFSRGVTIREPVHAHPGLLIRGQVSSDEVNCSAFQTVRIQRRRGEVWHTLGVDLTNESRRYREVVPDRNGRYRAVVRRSIFGDGAVCLRGVSEVVVHRH
jgi:hypothetical protein